MEPNGQHDQPVPPELVALIGDGAAAYIKRVDIEGVAAYAIHAADGSELAVMGDRDVAFAAARQHDLEPFSVH